MLAKRVHEFHGTDRFTIHREIGSGGMGVVYDALDRDRNAHVALKTLHNIEPEQLLLFKQEFRSLADIVHENLVPLYELISDGEHWFFTMEMIDGGVDFLSYIRGDSSLDSADTLIMKDKNAFQRETPVPADSGATQGNSAFRTMVNQSGTSSEAPEPTYVGTMGDADSAGSMRNGEAASSSISDDWNNDEEWSATSSPSTLPPVEVNIERVRTTMLQVAQGVNALHSHGKLHRDLKPANTMIRPDGTVVLLDFGLVVSLHDSSPNSLDSKDDETTRRQFAGTISYMAPEQANGDILTPAADWYAFGVMLFQTLTGRLPISGTPEKVLRKKCLRDGKAPSAYRSGIPKDLDTLCTELLKLDPTLRPSGTEILARLAGDCPATDAHLQTSNVNQGLPFVGRDRHLAKLFNAFDHTLRGEAIVQRIHGKSGAGKSALVHRFLDTITGQSRALVLAGKCYEQESVPYKAVDSLVDALTRYLLRVPTDEVEQLFPDEMGSLARIFPVLKRVPAIRERYSNVTAPLNLLALRSSAFLALRELMIRLGRKGPIVLYIDDLQWGDIDSAALLADLIRPPNAPPVLLLLSYRSEYFHSSECLQRLAELAPVDSSGTSDELTVDTLTPEETLLLTKTLIGPDSPDLSSKAEWIVRESGGSALFIYELVRYLKSGMDLSAIEGVHLDEVLWRRVALLPDDARILLEVVSVSGQPLPLRNAQEATNIEKLPPQIAGRLRSEQLVRSTGPTLDDDIETFHDRVRESVIGHLSKAVRTGWHRSLAMSLERSKKAEPDTLAFHFEHAGEPALASRYYLSAADNALEVLAFHRAENLFQRAAELADSDENRAAVYERMIHYYTDMARFEDAYTTACQATQLFGVRLPSRFIPPLFLLDFVKSKFRLRLRRTAKILDLPSMTDTRLQWVLRIGNACLKAAYQLRPELCVAVSTRLVNLCLASGNTPDCAIGYMVYGAIFQGGVLGFYKIGYEYGLLALSLVEKYKNAAQRAEVNFVVGYFGTSWLQPATEAEELWRTAYQSGLETNDLFHTGCSSAGTIMSYHMRGVPMNTVWEESEKFLGFLKRAQLREPIGCLAVVRQTICNLRGQTESRSSFSDENFDEDAFTKQLVDYGSRHFAHYYFINKMQVLYLWGDYDAAFAVARQSAAYLKDSEGMLHSAEHYLYHGLTMAALAEKNPNQRFKFLAAARKNHARFTRWAASCEHNFRHKECLLSAAISFVAGNTDAALEAYERSIRVAEQYGYVHVKAMAAQQASVLEHRRGNLTKSAEFRKTAVAAWQEWGATAYAEFVASQ